MSARIAQTLSRRHFLTAAAMGVFTAAAVSMSCTSRGCTARHPNAANRLANFDYVDRSGWILTVDDNRKLGPLRPLESR